MHGPQTASAAASLPSEWAAALAAAVPAGEAAAVAAVAAAAARNTSRWRSGQWGTRGPPTARLRGLAGASDVDELQR